MNKPGAIEATPATGVNNLDGDLEVPKGQWQEVPQLGPNGLLDSSLTRSCGPFGLILCALEPALHARERRGPNTMNASADHSEWCWDILREFTPCEAARDRRFMVLENLVHVEGETVAASHR